MPKLKELDHPGKADTTCKHQLVPVCVYVCVYYAPRKQNVEINDT